MLRSDEASQLADRLGFGRSQISFSHNLQICKIIQRACIAYHEAKSKELVEVLSLLADAVTAEVNEKGAGGYLLARLSDAKTILSKYHAARKELSTPQQRRNYDARRRS